jgi:nucleoside-diphosphate-sugar epimerase
MSVVSLRYCSVHGSRQRPEMASNAFCRATLADAPIEVYGDDAQTRHLTLLVTW